MGLLSLLCIQKSPSRVAARAQNAWGFGVVDLTRMYLTRNVFLAITRKYLPRKYSTRMYLTRKYLARK
jgi:hypothetical protein